MHVSIAVKLNLSNVNDNNNKVSIRLLCDSVCGGVCVQLCLLHVCLHHGRVRRAPQRCRTTAQLIRTNLKKMV